MPRPAVTMALGVVLALAASSCGGSKAKTSAATTSALTATTPSVPQGQPTQTGTQGNAACQSIPHPGGFKAVFGRRSSAAAAEALRQRAESRGFKGLDVEENACGSYSVTLPGLTDAKQFAAFRAEAKSAGFDVTLRCEAPPDNDGDIEAVFGFRRTHHLAVALKALVVHRGFIGAEIEMDGCNHWSVVVGGITSAVEKAFAAEALSAGFHVTFEPS